MYSVYIVKCSDDSLYTGITVDIERRIKQHNGIITGGAKYTSTRRPVKLVYKINLPNRSEASKEEYRIKKLTKKQKENLYIK